MILITGHKVIVKNPDPRTTLLTYLRNDLKLCGTKLGCGEGGCGACTVMVSLLDDNNKINHISVNACLAPLCSMHGAAVTTVEGIGSVKSKLHVVQKRIADAHGSQCGFCTPGIVMSMYTLLRNNPNPKMEDIETYFQVCIAPNVMLWSTFICLLFKDNFRFFVFVFNSIFACEMHDSDD